MNNKFIRDQRNPDKEMESIQNLQQPQEMVPEKSLAVRDVEEWIERVSQSRPELRGFSICPFAKTGVYKIIECLAKDIEIENGFDVIIYIIEESDLDKINEWVNHYNKKYDEWLFFEDCATYDTFIGEVQTNNGKHNLILAQPKEKLRKFREILKKTSYYTFWSKEYYDEIMIDDQRA
jgi:hypothetical protein